METPRDWKSAPHPHVTRSDIRAIDAKLDAHKLAEEAKRGKIWETLNGLSSRDGATKVVGALLATAFGACLTILNSTTNRVDTVESSVTATVGDLDKERINPLETAVDRHSARADQRLTQLEKELAETKEELDDAHEEIRRLQRYHGFRPVTKESE